MLDIIEEEQLCERAQRLGAELVEVLQQARNHLPGRSPIFASRGSMVAVEFNDPATHKPDAEFTRLVQRKALDAGLMLLSCGIHGNVIRFLYPLTIPDAQFKQALQILAQALKA